MTGKIAQIFIAPTAESRLLPMSAVRLEAERGIVGDRYHAGTGSFSKPHPDLKLNLTLIEAEEIDKFKRAHDVDLGYGEFRHNIVTRGLVLNTLIGKMFSINGIRMKGIEVCQPCEKLARSLHPAVMTDMMHRCGLRASVLGSGEIRVGDTIETGNIP